MQSSQSDRRVGYDDTGHVMFYSESTALQSVQSKLLDYGVELTRGFHESCQLSTVYCLLSLVSSLLWNQAIPVTTVDNHVGWHG